MTRDEAAAELVHLGQSFHQRGWMLGTSGNLSCVLSRDPLRLAITASAVDKGRLVAHHILELDSDGQPVGHAAHAPSAETRVHFAVVRSADAGAVLHTHSVWSTVLSDGEFASGGLAIQGYEMLKGLDGVTTHEHREWLPIVDNTQDMTVLAAAATAAIESSARPHGFLVRGHGLYTWAKDLPTAARHVEILEFLLEVRGRSAREATWRL